MTTCPYGFRIVGTVEARRRLVDAGRALLAYAASDDRAELHREAYLSAFQFEDDFRAQLERTGSTRGFQGVCWSPFLWFDLDNDSNLDAVLQDARALASLLLDRYATLADEDLLIFFSGSKGFHVGLPTSLWQPPPSPLFNHIMRRMAEQVAALARVRIDTSVYDKVRAFRAPNSRHPRTGLHKRRVFFDALLRLSVEGIKLLAERPDIFELPEVHGTDGQALVDWQECERIVEEEAKGRARLRAAAADGSRRLNRLTLDFIRDGADLGDRHRLLFSAAANLAEFACSFELAYALLAESALDSGLPPSEVRRQIECGLAHGTQQKGGRANA